jgi:hypothetical protein
MCCVPGRCPCWPREEPFDASEMDLLHFLQRVMCLRPADYYDRVTRGTFLANLQGASAKVQRSRLGYVLSTFVRLEDESCSMTALQLMGTESDMVKWLLHIGVCPNMGLYYGHRRVVRSVYLGWIAGPWHPGRPSQDTQTVLQHFGAWLDDKSSNVFLAYGAYPRRGTDERHEALQQWHRWHARASRRLWVEANLDGLNCP